MSLNALRQLVAVSVVVITPALSSDKAVTPQPVALRDSFVNQIKAEGFQPSVPSPKIVLDNEPSFGGATARKYCARCLWEALEHERRMGFQVCPVRGRKEHRPLMKLGIVGSSHMS